jgi:molecular chaperone Hsp33
MAVPGKTSPVGLPPAESPADNSVITFRTERSGVHGRLVRLGSVADQILRAHAMPDAASGVLGEGLVLAALLGSALPGEGNISIQTRTGGAVPMLYADCEAPGKLRGYARFEAARLPAPLGDSERYPTGDLLGEGHLAVTVDQGAAEERYQGVIALDGESLDVAAAAYFEQRENLPTFTRLAVARHYAGAQGGLPAAMKWRGGGLMMQRLECGGLDESGDDPWQRVRMLAATIEDHELLDPLLSSERLLLRLFQEEGVIVDRVVPLSGYCKCSREKILSVLNSFGAKELADMQNEDGKISVTCQFCAKSEVFEFSEIGLPQG